MTTRSGAEFAELERTVADLRRRLDESRSAYAERIDHQTATIDVLKAMAASPGDPQPVFDIIAERARAICGSYGVSLFEFDGTLVHLRAWNGVSEDPAVRAAYVARYPRPPSREFIEGRVILDRQAAYFRDTRSEPGLTASVRSGVGVPLLRGGAVIGVIGLGSLAVDGFSEAQIELLKTFAEQAVIAIGGAETYRALQDRTDELAERNSAYGERIEHQSATIDVLKAMSASPGDPQPVFDLIAQRARDICGGYGVSVFEYDGALMHLRAYTGVSDNPAVRASYEARFPMPPPPDVPSGMAILEGRTAQIDIASGTVSRHVVRDGTVRSGVGVPMLRGKTVIGALGMGSRETGGFSDTQIELLKTFAEQAVIAITSAEAHRNQREALERQTATAEVLQVINASPGNLPPVFHAMLEKAIALCEASFGMLRTFDGEHWRAAATINLPELVQAHWRIPAKTSPGGAHERLMRGERVVHSTLATSDEGYLSGFPSAVALIDGAGARTYLAVALRQDERLLGSITIYRQEARPFTVRQIALLEDFAAQAVIAIENTRLLTEQREALERQTAMADVLAVINANPGNLTPVFDAILRHALQLSEAAFGTLWTFDGNRQQVGATQGIPKALAEARERTPDDTISPLVERMFVERRTVHQLDIREGDGYRSGNPRALAVADLGHARTLLVVPLVKDQTVLGALQIYRREVRAFSEKQIALVENFAAQAVIAMDNARLLTEQREALERQTATAEVLQTINANPGNLVPVFDSMLEKAALLCDAQCGSFFMIDGDTVQAVVSRGLPAELHAELTQKGAVGPLSGVARVARGEGVVHLPDMRLGPSYLAGEPTTVRTVDVFGLRTWLGVPLRKDGVALGLLAVARFEVRPFTERQIDLLKSFAAQAVIAMENARLLGELREALERQTATAEVVGIINASPGDLAPVFDAMLERALRLSGVAFGIMHKYDGELFQVVATLGVPPAFEAFRRRHPFPVSPETPPGQAILTGRSTQVSDVATDPFFAARPELQDAQLNLGGIRAVLNVPMIKDGQPVGMFVVYRAEPGVFPDKQIALLESFAAQAVIAMENARLLTEQREALERQTAMADLLGVINANPGNLAPVFEAILEKAHSLCGVDLGALNTIDGDVMRAVATRGYSPEAERFSHIPRPAPAMAREALARGERFVHLADLPVESGSLNNASMSSEHRHAFAAMGARTSLTALLCKDNVLIGIISAYRTEVKPFSGKEIALLENFAAQAVIAMDNARLLNEIRQRQSELDITFENMGDGVAMFDRDRKLAAWNRNFQDILDLPDDAVRVGLPFDDYIRGLAESGDYGPDANADEQIARLTALLGQPNRFERARPNGRVIDIRQNPIPGGGFVVIYADITERKHAEEALRAARDDAEAALRELKVAQASLVQAEKMASLGQLTAGIAHEIKNPLNFVNNFAALSVELLDELKQVTAPALATLDDDARADADDLTGTLTSNLHKIEEHGKRADSIVRGMLEHSRASTGERRAVDLNELVEEALNLAYHGARARDQSFNITLERDYAADIAPIEVAPQDLTRVFLNLFGNGFDAARSRQKTASAGFEPALRVSTRDRGGSVEIRVRDNGTGVPPEIRDKLFQPFFTTKPTGEGTGLGLSISYDIVTQQHGGSIVLDSEQNVFTEFTVTIPRGVASAQGGTP